jgi:hypothetical protein
MPLPVFEGESFLALKTPENTADMEVLLLVFKRHPCPTGCAAGEIKNAAGTMFVLLGAGQKRVTSPAEINPTVYTVIVRIFR